MTSTRPLNVRRDDIDSKSNSARPRIAHLHIQQPAAPNTCGRNRSRLAASLTAQSQQHAPASPAHAHRDYMTPFGFVSAPAPDFTIYAPSLYSPFVGDNSSDAFLSASFAPDFLNGFGPGMGEPVAVQRATKRARVHQRTPSASTVASNGPASPYSATTLYPQIASSERSPSSPLHLVDQTLFAKPYPSDNFFGGVSYMPSPATRAVNPQAFAMKGVAFDQSRDDLSNVFQPARLSMSSQSNGSPASAMFGGGAYGNAVDTKSGSSLQNEYTTPNPNVQLFRTDSQAYQDNLYNPSTSYVATPVTANKRKSEYLSPHANLISERLQTANMMRSTSPNSALSRDKSPFRDGSPLAATNDWRNAGVQIATAADLRRQQKEEAEQAEYAQLMPQLKREPTKTISPKDAVLDGIDPDQPSLFQETIPAGYKQHTSPTDVWATEFVPQPGSTFGNLSAVTSGQAMPPFRATSGDEFVANYDYMPSPSDQIAQAQLHAASLQRNMYAGSKMKFADSNPEFPTNLVRMESSVSDNGLGFSSQDSAGNMSMPQRPLDTRANTGAYSCTYHGCAQRFDSYANLQKHKKDYHRAQMQQQLHEAQQQAQQQLRQQQSTESESGETPSSSSGSPGSPTSVGTSMTPAAIAARNSQAGPHKCTRINPSTNKPCNTVFSRPYDLTRHEDTIHNGRKQKVRCPMCREEKTFSRSDALTRHMRVVHPEVETLGKRGRRGD